MSSQTNPRKRAAPGSDLSNDQFLQWGSAGIPQSYDNTSAYVMNNGYPQNAPSSNQLARRPINQAMTRTTNHENVGNQWSDHDQSNTTEGPWLDIQELEAKAQIAKQDAKAKRKQIPPFVQKLNSFLEDGKNTDLIRWSDEGDSFIVLDEDEFAKTLIPELFKHNNYASFVRQLNMYGFHKKVGLSDNSMRASERKNKTPSEYSNPYFRRGHQDLLWLIQKPKTTTGKKGKKADPDQPDEDVDDYIDDAQISDTRIRPRPQLTLGHGENTLSQEQLTSIQRELSTIKQQQGQIRHLMAGLKREHEALYGQAATFQDQHSRHENSINAILTFLATVYRGTLQGHEGLQGIQNLFAGQNPIPVDQTPGAVVDMGDYNFDQLQSENMPPNKPFKKAPLLITDGSQQGRAQTMSPSTANSPFPPRQNRRPSQSTYRTRTTPQPAVEELFDSGDTPIQTMPTQQDIMNVIKDSNARNSVSNPDFSNMITDLQNSGGSNPLNASERADMLRLINSTGGNSSNGDNALINATPPPFPTNFDRNLADARVNYDSLAKMQAEQDKSVQNLTDLLQPLSPSGSIPGIHDNQTLPPAPWNVEEFLSGDHGYFDGFTPDGPNFSLDTSDANAAAPFNDYDDMFNNVPPNTTQSDAGRVDSASIASSEVATPNSNAEASDVSTTPIRKTANNAKAGLPSTQQPTKRVRRN